MRRTYHIDICRICGAHAAIFGKGCGHRSETEPWTIPVVVEITRQSERVLERERTRRLERLTDKVKRLEDEVARTKVPPRGSNGSTLSISEPKVEHPPVG